MWRTRNLDREDSIPNLRWKSRELDGFRRVFKELLKISELGPVLKLVQLMSMLPEDAKKRIIGVEEPAEA